MAPSSPWRRPMRRLSTISARGFSLSARPSLLLAARPTDSNAAGRRTTDTRARWKRYGASACGSVVVVVVTSAPSRTEVAPHDALPDAGVFPVVPPGFLDVAAAPGLAPGGERNDAGLVVGALRALDHEQGAG